MRKINPKKNEKLKRDRGATFEEVVENGELVAIKENANYTDQFLMIYSYKGYAWVVVIGEHPDRFITLYKSRKFKKEFKI